VSWEAALYSELTGDATVSGIVGTRVYPMGEVAQNATLPYVTYSKTGYTRERYQGGRAGLVPASVQIDCWAQGAKDALDLKAAVAAAIDDKRGTLGSGASAETVKLITIYDEQSFYEKPEAGEEIGVQRQMLRATIWYVSSA
jgi:hypothetical protein